MAFKKGQSGNLAGKPKGATNKTTRAAKEAIQEAFEKLGGVAALVKFGKKNPAVFYGSIWAKIIPMDVKHEGGVELIHKYEVPETRPISR